MRITNRSGYRRNSCHISGTKESCSGSVPNLDYIPRNYSVSLGFDSTPWNPNKTSHYSLLGVKYNFSLTDETNSTDCKDLPPTPTGPLYHCSSFYKQYSFPNLFGGDQINEGQFLVSGISISNFEYYQHLTEAICYGYIPRCDPSTFSTIPLCREGCSDFINGCKETLGQEGFKHFSQESLKCLLDFRYDYLPTVTSNIPCWYKPVVCHPPDLGDAEILSRTMSKGIYTVGSQIEYRCQGNSGSHKIMCGYSGNWTDLENCNTKETFPTINNVSPTTNNVSPTINNVFPTIKIVLGITLPGVFLVILVVVFLKLCRLGRPLENLTRMKTFDAFVCYCLKNEEDLHFAETTIKNALEEVAVPPFKLCIHRRDFLPGYDILWSISNTIKNSNSAIVLSQSFVDSPWCKEEFEQCYMENMRDPAFKLFVVMMANPKNLNDLSTYMESFLDKKTYLERADERLFLKIADYLTWVKKPKEKRKGNANQNFPVEDGIERIEMECENETEIELEAKDDGIQIRD